VASDTKPTINEDVLNNIGTIEVVVLRCQDDPDNPPLNPFDFPKLPILSKPKTSTSGTRSKTDQKAPIKKSNRKEPSNNSGDDELGGLGGLVGLFDGAADDPFDFPMGLDGNWDSDRTRSRRHDSRSRRGFTGSSHNGKHYHDEDDGRWPITSSEDDRERHVRFQNSTPARERSPGRYLSPSSSRFSRHEREPSVRGSRGRSPDRDDYVRDRYDRDCVKTRSRHMKRDSECPRDGDEPLFRYVEDGREELGRGRRCSYGKEWGRKREKDQRDADARLDASILLSTGDPRRAASPLVTEYPVRFLNLLILGWY
jgi:hypothetical protein